MFSFANRASAVLYNFLKRLNGCKPFLLPSNVCPVVPLSFLKVGVDFEFVDIDDSHALDKKESLARIETGRYGGILFVHAYGKKFDNSSFYSRIKKLDSTLSVIDDCCLCEPDTSDKLEQDIDLQLFSTGYAKFIELSYGGYGKMQREGIKYECQYDKVVEVKQQQYIKECFKTGARYGLNPNLPWLDSSPFKMNQQEYFSIIDAKRKKVKIDKERINAIYRKELPNSIQMGEDFQNWRFMILVEDQEKVLDAIFKAGLFAGTNFPSVSYMFKGVGSPVAQEESKHIIINDFRFSEEQAHKVCQVINSVI